MELLRQMLERWGMAGQFWVNWTGAHTRLGPFDRREQAETVARGVAEQHPRERISVLRHNYALDEDQICFTVQVGGNQEAV